MHWTIVTPTEIHQYAQTLRLYLADMCRVTQHCVDCATKALQLGDQALDTSVRNSVREIDMLHSDLTMLAWDLFLIDASREPDFRFVVSSTRMCNALQGLYISGLEIVAIRMRTSANAEQIESEALVDISNHANRLVRLCTVALLEEHASYAAAVLSDDRVEQQFATAFSGWLRKGDRRTCAQTEYVVAVANHLIRMVWYTREIADAIVFWLGDGGS
jgi:hypothetical protein